mmetsp:Transcript_28685/g.92545  ORF Transcript_28685/g.92545 Transcript_28685/m.92545 type:complete len:242 (-) Transcript_28685:221-946(-)
MLLVEHYAGTSENNLSQPCSARLAEQERIQVGCARDGMISSEEMEVGPMYQEEISSSRHVELVSVAEVNVVTLASKESPLTHSHVVSSRAERLTDVAQRFFSQARRHALHEFDPPHDVLARVKHGRSLHSGYTEVRIAIQQLLAKSSEDVLVEDNVSVAHEHELPPCPSGSDVLGHELKESLICVALHFAMKGIRDCDDPDRRSRRSRRCRYELAEDGAQGWLALEGIPFYHHDLALNMVK